MSGPLGLLERWLLGEIIPSLDSNIHQSIHAGHAWHGSALFSGTPVGGLVQYLLLNGPTDFNLIYSVHAGADAFLSLLEAPTVAVSGTPLTVRNRDRNVTDPSLVTPPVLTFMGGTGTAGGTLLTEGLLPGGSGAGSPGGKEDEDTEWLLKPNTAYLLRVRNVGAAAAPISVSVELYHETAAPTVQSPLPHDGA